MALPANVNADEVTDAAVTPNDDLWLTRLDPTSGQVAAYGKVGDAAWRQVDLVPAWPDNAQVTAPSSAEFFDAGDNAIAIVVTAHLGNAVGASNLFVSADGGETFAREAFTGTSECYLIWTAVSQPTPSHIDVVAGPSSDRICSSDDAGATWSQQDVSGLPPGATQLGIDRSIRTTSKTLFPAFTDDKSGAQALTLLEDDTKSGFHAAPEFNSLKVGDSYSAALLPTAATGDTVWVAAGHTSTIYVARSGQAWTSLAATDLPENILSLSVTDDMNADVVASQSSCTDGKTNCTSVIIHYATADGGLTWRPSF